MNVDGPWCLIGDFNNLLRAQDKIGGNMVTENEYKDLVVIMEKTRLHEKESIRTFHMEQQPN